ncbi:MAG: hypothetical protein GY804_12755 [Alphaproteobacteria bacterium]|nr:hypothetical protein [Alphaproteobacteria bacterium]
MSYNQDTTYASNPSIYNANNTVESDLANRYRGTTNPHIYHKLASPSYETQQHSYISVSAPPTIPAVTAPPYKYNALGAGNINSYIAKTSEPQYESFRDSASYDPYSSGGTSTQSYRYDAPVQSYNQMQTSHQAATTDASNRNVYTPYQPTPLSSNSPQKTIEATSENVYKIYDYNQQNLLLDTLAATGISSMLSTPTSIPPHLDPKKSQNALNDAIKATSYENVTRDSGRNMIFHSPASRAPRSLLTSSNYKSKPLSLDTYSRLAPTSYSATTNNSAPTSSIETTRNFSDAQNVIKDIKASINKTNNAENLNIASQASSRAKSNEIKVASIIANISKEAENKEMGIDPRKMWSAHSGDDLRTLLTSWAKEAGWHVIWKSDRQYTLAAGTKMKGKFINVSSALVRAFGRARPAPHAVYYRGNKVLLVTTMEDDNAE